MVPTSLWFSAMVVTGLGALVHVSAPAYLTYCRVFTVLLVLAGEVVYLGRRPAWLLAACVALTSLGALVAGYAELPLHFGGAVMSAGHCLAAAGFLVSIGTAQASSDLSTLDMMFYVCLLSLPVVAGLAVREAGELAANPKLLGAGSVMSFAASSVNGAALLYLMFLCSTVNTPLTTAVVGQARAVVVTVVGLVVFADVPLKAMLAVGLGLSVFGVAGYCLCARVQERRAAMVSQSNDN
eukprot:m51a1_g1533 putative drug metabolite transporter superfamily (239) ;mRNA; f:523558-524431